LRLLAKSDKLRKEIYVFSDMARSSWSSTLLAQLQRTLGEVKDVGIFLIDVGVKEPRNFGLGELRLSGQVLSRNVPLRISTALLASGAGGERSVELYMSEDGGAPTKRDQQLVKVRADEGQA